MRSYHDWEHFSSVRNLTGPHAGLPYVVEKPATTAQAKAAARSHAGGSGANKSWSSAKPESQSSQSSLESSPLTDISADFEPEGEPVLEQDDEQIDIGQGLLSPVAVPLPMSRTPSPPPSSETSASQSASVTSSQPGLPLLPGYNCPTDYARLRMCMARGSPKRAYDNADEGAEDSQGEAKRSRRNSFVGSKPNSRVGGIRASVGRSSTQASKVELDNDIDVDGDTPDLLSSAESSSNDHSSSPATTPPPSTVVVPPTPTMPPSTLSPSATKHMTKRQRKRLGLPKASGVNIPVGGGGGARMSAGKIKVPGGKYKRPDAAGEKPVSKESEDADAAWIKNGNGRMDVRGFKELKI